MFFVPRPISVITGEQESVGPVISKFFDEAIKYVKSIRGEEPNYFQMKSGMLTRRMTGDVTDDGATYLLYKDRLVACVMETRTEFNHVRYTFFADLNCLDDLR